MRRTLLCGAAAVGLSGLACGAQAQQTGAAQVAAAEAPALSEVVVTARRRSENLEKVPVAVTAFSSAKIQQKGITDRTTLADFTPSMITITGGYPSEFAYFALRGQGPAFGSVPGVIPYFAEVANPVGIDGRVGTYFDLSNVQVLAGPQGTLFGKNATGGNILFEPQRPTNRFGGYVQGEYGNYNDRRGEGAINIPIVKDKVLLRLAGEVGARDGYTTDVGPNFPGKDYDNLNYDSVRASLILRPADWLELYSVARYYYSNNNGPGTILQQLNPATIAGLTPFLPGIGDALAQQQALGPRRVSYDLNEFSKTQYWQFINHATIHLNSSVEIDNVVSYSQFRDRYGYDYDATPYPIAGQSSRDIPTLAPNYLTEEIRLQGRGLGDALNYTAGFYYDNQSWSGPAGIEDYYTAPLTLFIGPVSAIFVETNSSRAVFGQASFNIGDKVHALRGLSVTGGLRYTWEDSTQFATIIAPPAQGGSVSSQYPSYTFDIDEDLGPAHFYLAIRDAYKSGGINAGAPPEFATFPPERLQDYEIGAKSQFNWGDVGFRLNADAYRGNYTNIQRTVPQDVGGIFLNVNESAAAAVIQGVEFTGVVVPTRGLELDVTYSYMDSRYTKISSVADSVLLGAAFPYTPKNKVSVGATYETPLSNGIASLVLSANYTYQSKFSTAQTNEARVAYLPGYGYLNASVALKDIGGRPVDVELFGTNLTNALYATGLLDQYNTPSGIVTYTYAPPRMFGVRVRYRFGG
ncbi:MAG TPA: TonB-dependent receptor plug domain-containing protein [Caulobacteraceae bacterium]|jgi:iron complex outermembrane receptor protein